MGRAFHQGNDPVMEGYAAIQKFIAGEHQWQKDYEKEKEEAKAILNL